MSTQAAFLHALADHIARHDLPPVDISNDHGGGWHLHLHTRDTAPGLVAWARSLNTVTLTVRPLSGQVDVAFCSQLGGRPIQVWGCVNGLRGLIGSAELVSTDYLAHFAEHGSLPGGAK